jgi:hypothetical protein
VAAELQRKDFCMWLCEDLPSELSREVDLGDGGKVTRPGRWWLSFCAAVEDSLMGLFACGGPLLAKPPGFYVQRPTGLFPAALPQEGDTINAVPFGQGAGWCSVALGTARGLWAGVP